MSQKSSQAWVVHKFGGTSVANAERYRKVADIVSADASLRKAVVVSAMSGVTDRLIELIELARKQDAAYTGKLQELKQKHVDTIRDLLAQSKPEAVSALIARVDTDFENIQDLLKAVWISRNKGEQTIELISGHGEVWSAQILHAYFTSQGISCRCLDAREALVVSPGETGPVVDWDVSQHKLDAWLKAEPSSLLVITGYVASTHDGVATTLKRNGSDFSASIFAKLLDSSCITIWTDVDGVLSADPRRVPEAVVLDEMSYQEAIELAYFGAKVIHPHTMAPALQKGIPIWIRNTFNSSHPGTKIHHSKDLAKGAANGQDLSRTLVKGFTTVDKVALINLEGTGMIGVPGIANRLFGSLREAGVSVIMISQASSEHSICFAVPEEQGSIAKTAVEKAFYSEIQQGQIQSVELLFGSSILAAVGDDMVNSRGVAAKFFQALGKAGINIRAIAQGSSERNISVVVNQSDATRALRAVHAGFFLSAQTLSVGLMGPGLIGSALLEQLEAQSEWLRKHFNIDLRVRGIANSKKMLLDERGVSLKEWKTRFEKESVAMKSDEFTRHVHADYLPHSVMIDCTSSEDVAACYSKWLEQGIHVITPNKKANSGSLETYRTLRKLGREHRSHYLYEATVGAGLPVVTTLRDLIQTGDEIFQIEGVLSGTLSYLFNSFNDKTPFSSIVRDAKRMGYTEPDPRDDLSGRDVARKLIILSREMGLSLELEDISVQNLVSKDLQGKMDPEEFLDRLALYDEEMAKLQRDAQACDEVLRYVGIVSASGASGTIGGKASVELKRYPKTHPFARIQATDNIIAFTTRRYHRQPLIVQGPGAGPEVTAGGVFADLLRLAAYLGAPS